jgi:SAM-dependent methyltransferase
MMKLYTDLAEYYYEIEKTGRRFPDEIEFIDSLFQKYKINSCLDLGCGTGEHVSAIQKRGYTVLGMDSSMEMLSVAKKRHPQCDFFQGNLQMFKTKSPVDGMICLFGTFNYLIDDAEVNSSLQAVRNNLKSSGLLFLEVWNSIPIRKIKRKPIAPVSVSRMGNSILKRNRGFKITGEHLGEENIVEVNFIFDLDSKIIKDKHIMRVFTKEEISIALERNKLQVLEMYGGYRMEKLNSHSGRMLIVCKKKA